MLRLVPQALCVLVTSKSLISSICTRTRIVSWDIQETFNVPLRGSLSVRRHMCILTEPSLPPLKSRSSVLSGPGFLRTLCFWVLLERHPPWEVQIPLVKSVIILAFTNLRRNSFSFEMLWVHDCGGDINRRLSFLTQCGQLSCIYSTDSLNMTVCPFILIRPRSRDFCLLALKLVKIGQAASIKTCWGILGNRLCKW